MSLLPEHSHCLHCDDPVDEGQEYCSDECKAAAEGEAKKERNKNLVFFGIVGVLLMTFTVIMALG